MTKQTQTPTANTILDAAYRYIDAGFLVLPANTRRKCPTLRSFKQYRRKPPTVKQNETWFSSAEAMCMLTGEVSGSLEVLDFDQAGRAFGAWCDVVEERDARLLQRLVVQKSQSGGRHVFFRNELLTPKSKTLARTTTPDDNRTNLYLLGLAHSAAGKDWPRKLNVQILHRVCMADCIGERFASGEGIQDALHLTPSMLFQTDEVDGMLQSIKKSNDARYENVLSTLLTMYSSANTVYPMRRKAGKESPGTIDQPSLVVFGTAIPNHYYAALSERMLTNGFFARMMILECGERGEGQEPKIAEVPDTIMDVARWWADYKPGTGNLHPWHPQPTIVPHDDPAKKILVEARLHAEREYTKAERKNDSVGTTVWGRVNEQTRKLALLYAISVNHESPVIDEAAAKWAMTLVDHLTKRMLFMASSHVAESPFATDCLKVFAKIRKEDNHTIPHSKLLKAMDMEALLFKKLIATLEERGDIIVERELTAGRTGTHYRLNRLQQAAGAG